MRGRSFGGELVWMSAFLVGAGLRVWQLGDLALANDEWHAVNKLLNSDFYAIATDLGFYDHSIPLTLLYKALAETVGLNEWLMRTPSLLFGTVSTVLIPWLLRDTIGRPAAWVLALLLAFSPLHICYSRLARPYAILLLLETLALVAFFGWLYNDDRRRLAVCAGAFTLGVWLNLSMAPLLLALVFAAACSRLISRDERLPGWKKLTQGALSLAIGPVLLLFPALVSNPSALGGKVAYGKVAWTTLPWSVQLILGTACWPLVAVLAGLLFLGMKDLSNHERRFWGFAGLAAAGHVTLVVTLGPHQIAAGPAFVRYSSFLCPLGLALVARGVVVVGRHLRRLRPVPHLAILALLPGLVLLGPLPNVWRWPDLSALQEDYRHEELLERIRNLDLPSYYTNLSRYPPGGRLVVEAPWYFFWNHIPYYRVIHGQRTLVGFVAPAAARRPGEIPPGQRDVRLANGVHVGDHARLRELRVDEVIFHKILSEEFPGPYSLPPVDVNNWVEEYRRWFGDPVFEDSTLAVFRLRSDDSR